MIAKKLVQCLAVVASVTVMAASAHAQNRQIRDGFWISGGLGYGSLGCDLCGSQRESGISGDLSLGGTISPRFLLGVGSAGWTKSDQGATLTVGTLDARVRFYPSTTGGFSSPAASGSAPFGVTLAADSVPLRQESERFSGLAGTFAWQRIRASRRTGTVSR